MSCSRSGISFEQHHVWLRFVEIGDWDRSSRPDLESPLFLLTEGVVQFFDDELMFGTNGGHLNKKTVDQLDAVVWVQDSGLAEPVVLVDRKFSQDDHWFIDRAVKNRFGHKTKFSGRLCDIQGAEWLAVISSEF